MPPISTTRFQIPLHASAQMISSPRQYGSKGSFMTYMSEDVHSTFRTRKSLMARTPTLETKSFLRDLHGPKPRSCKYCSLGPKPGHRCHHNTISCLSLMIGSLPLPPVFMISQTSTLQHVPDVWRQ